MLNLIKIECFKMFKCKIVFCSMIVCMVSVVAFGFFLKQDIPGGEDSTEEERQLQEAYQKSTDWKDRLRIQMQLNSYLSDIYGEDEIEVKNQLLQYRIDHELKPGGENTAWDFAAYSLEVIGFIVSVCAIIFSVEVNVREYACKTIKFIFTKPYPRQKIVLAKYVTSIIYTLVLSIFCYIAALFTGGACFTFGGAGDVTVVRVFHTVFSCSAFAESMLYFASSLMASLLAMTVAFFLGIVCRGQVIPLITAAGLLLFGNMIAEKIYLSGFEWVRFSLLPNLTLNNFIDSPVAKGYSLPLFLSVAAVHILVLAVGSVYVMKKTDL